MKIRALLVDDEPLARQRMRRLLSEHPDVELLAEAASGREFLELVLDRRPDLLFLDVNMPGQDGLSALERLHELLPEEQRPLVVFTTAYEEHALRAFELEGTDYLVKPIERETLARALRRVRRALGGGAAAAIAPSSQGADARKSTDDDSDASAAGTPAPARRDGPITHLAALKGGKILNLALDLVAGVTLEDSIAYAHTPAGKFRLRQNLTELEKRLPCPPFLRVSRSALLNLDWVAHLDPLFSGNYLATLRSPLDLEIQVSRRRARRLKELIGY